MRRSPLSWLYLAVIVLLLGVIGFGGMLVRDHHRLHRAPFSVVLTVTGIGADRGIESMHRYYQVGAYSVWEVGAARIASHEKDLFPTGGTSAQPIWLDTTEREVKRVRYRHEAEHGHFGVVRASWTEGDTFFQEFRKQRHFMIIDGVLIADKRRFDILEKPILIILDENGKFLSVEDLPSATAPVGLQEAQKAVAELRSQPVAAP